MHTCILYICTYKINFGDMANEINDINSGENNNIFIINGFD
jgi:hypothetical protein